MSRKHSFGRLRLHAGSLIESLRQFLTPALWKQAQKTRRSSSAMPRRKNPSRWRTQPLILMLLGMTWCCGDSQAERFETAKAVCGACLVKRRRPGRTKTGFQKALGKLPLPVLRTLAAGVRRRLATVLKLSDDGFVVLSCDGSMVECPRTAELERRLGDRGKKHSAPALWVTTLVHLRTGVLWGWRLGKSVASERVHLKYLLRTLPASALIVADSGFSGYWLAEAILQVQASFLIRIGGKDTFYTDHPLQRSAFAEGLVYAWPRVAQGRKQKPLRLRAIRVHSKKTRKVIWLLTNVLDSQRLPASTAARYYRWRWENEGTFRTYKRTLNKMKLMSRTLRLVHREAEGSLLAVQLLLALGAQAIPQPKTRDVPLRCSPRRVLLAIRSEMQQLVRHRRRWSFSRRLTQAIREQRPRTSSKVKRRWPRREDHAHKKLKAPHFLTLTEKQKSLMAQLERTAA